MTYKLALAATSLLLSAQGAAATGASRPGDVVLEIGSDASVTMRRHERPVVTEERAAPASGGSLLQKQTKDLPAAMAAGAA